MKILASLVLLFPLIASAQDGARPGVEISSRDSGPQLIDLAVAPSVVDRQPQDVSDTYPASVGTLYCWTALKNSEEPTELKHVWRHGDRVVSEVPVQVGKSSRWRTWTRQRIDRSHTGEWSCDIVDEGGESLGRAKFTLQ